MTNSAILTVMAQAPPILVPKLQLGNQLLATDGSLTPALSRWEMGIQRVRRATFTVTMLLIFNIQDASARPSAESIAKACAGCHGTFGASIEGMPSIDKLSQQAIAEALQAFKSGQRKASVMDRIAKGLTDQDIEALALFFSQRPKP